MFTHILVGSSDPEKSKAFYDAALGAIGLPSGMPFGRMTVYPKDDMAFGFCEPRNGEPASFGNGSTVSFRAETREQIDAFHAAGLEAGGSDEGAPGIRENAPGNAYGAYLRDPDGNKICAFAQVPKE